MSFFKVFIALLLALAVKELGFCRDYCWHQRY